MNEKKVVIVLFKKDLTGNQTTLLYVSNAVAKQHFVSLFFLFISRQPIINLRNKFDLRLSPCRKTRLYQATVSKDRQPLVASLNVV